MRNGQLRLTDAVCCQVSDVSHCCLGVEKPLSLDSCAFNSSECLSNVSDITS